MRNRIFLAFAGFSLLLGVAIVLVGIASAESISTDAGAVAAAKVTGVAWFAGATILLAGSYLGLVVARRILRPIEEIGTLVDLYDPDELADELASRSFPREISSLAARLEHAMRRVDAAVEREKKFTHYASHELRTPVAVIRGAAELLRATADMNSASLRRPIERIERSVGDMEALIEAFLWLARDHSQPGSTERCAVVPIVRDTITKYRYLLEGKVVTVEVVEAGQPSVEAPPTVIGVVVGNLIANAFHHTDEGKVIVEIGPGAVSVCDTGGGIELDELDSCSESFVRGEKSVGYGLGLAIVHSLVNRFGWWLELESVPGEGTTATLRF